MFSLRPIRPADKDALQRFHGRLSADTRYRRFHAAKGALSGRELRYLTEVDGDRHVAIVAVDAHGELAAVARVISTQHGAEIAVVVADDRRGHGLGERVCREALERFWTRHDEPVCALVQGDNLTALRLFRRLGGARTGLQAGTVTVTLTYERYAPRDAEVLAA